MSINIANSLVDSKVSNLNPKKRLPAVPKQINNPKHELVEKIKEYNNLQVKIDNLKKIHEESQVHIRDLRKAKIECKKKTSNLESKLNTLASKNLQLDIDKSDLLVEKKQLQARSEAIETKLKNLQELQKQSQQKTQPQSAPTVKSPNDQKTEMAIRNTLVKVLGVSAEELANLSLLPFFDSQNKCLKVDQISMDILITFLKSHPNANKVNFTAFKIIQENTLVKFFVALPDTGVKSVSMARQLTEDENNAKEVAEKKIPNLKVQLPK